MIKDEKFQSVIAYYFLTLAVIYQFVDVAAKEVVLRHQYLLVLVCLIELGLVIWVLKRLIKDQVMPYSLLITQVIIIAVSFFAFEFSTPLVFIILSLTAYLVLKQTYTKNFLMTNQKAYNYLRIRNKLPLYVIYIGYEAVAVTGLWFSKGEELFQEPLNLIYYALYPYLILILMLFRLSLDKRTDYYNTLRRFKKEKKKARLRFNLILIIFGMLLLILK